jgi:hypothetical protein
MRKKPFYTLRLSILEPKRFAGRVISGRVYCTAKALWKLGRFLRDFLYDPESLGREEVDENALAGLRGVVKVSHTTVNGTSLLNFDGFAPASQWEELSFASSPNKASPEVAVALASTGIAISTDGGRRTLEQQCSSAERSNRPCLLTFGGRTLQPCCSENGLFTRTAPSNTPTAQLGIACCNKGSSLSSVSHKMTAFVFANPGRTCRFHEVASPRKRLRCLRGRDRASRRRSLPAGVENHILSLSRRTSRATNA